MKPLLVDLETAWRGGQNQALLLLKGLRARHAGDGEHGGKCYQSHPAQCFLLPSRQDDRRPLAPAWHPGGMPRITGGPNGADRVIYSPTTDCESACP